MAQIMMQPIGHVRGGRSVVEDDEWGDVVARIELDPAVVDADATAGLDGFSHVEVLFCFDRVDEAAVCRSQRHPRGRTDWPSVGILAQRAKDRPNRIGLTTCELVGSGPGWLEVRGLDAVDGTPVLDVKPYMVEFAPRTPVHGPPWATELMAGYW